MDYRRAYVRGGCYFFTVVLEDRTSNLLIEKIDLLRTCIKQVKARHPFNINAIVILPDHIHTIWTLPEHDQDYAKRWMLIKSTFSRALEKTEHINSVRIKKRERGIWQRRFWEHVIRDEQDFLNHIEYIHQNPVKHGYVQNAIDWQYSSIHKLHEA